VALAAVRDAAVGPIGPGDGQAHEAEPVSGPPASTRKSRQLIQREWQQIGMPPYRIKRIRGA